MNTTTFPKEAAKLKPLFTATTVAILMLLSVIAGILGTVILYESRQLRVPDFVSIQGSVYYDAENKGVTVTYWRGGKSVGTAEHVISAVCRNLALADSITIKTPWP